MKKTLFLALLLASATTYLHAQAVLHPPDWLTSCTLENVDADALCGTYEVWENRTKKQGRRLDLNVVVVPALSTERMPDPVFFFRGGPGAAATEAIRGVMRLLSSVHQRRDLVFVDVRGTGQSNALDCPVTAPDAPLQDYFTEFLSEDFVRKCLAQQDAEVGLYTVPIAMDDINEVRAALGYGQINLYGSSGGTRAEQVYMRRHPETVRTAVLKGVAPMDMENPLPFAKVLEVGVNALIAACEAEAACREAYPALRNDWERSKQYFDNGRVEAEVAHPFTKRRERVLIDKGVYADGVRHILYTVRGSRRLPGMIHAAGRGDFDLFAQRELEQTIGFQRGISFGMFMSSTCAEDLRFVAEEDIERTTAGTFLGDYRVRRQLAACEIWGWGEGITNEFQEPVRVDVPVLLISGAYDTATSPEGGERVARHLPNSRHVVFPNQSHGYANPACALRLITDFIETANTEGLDLACVAETRRPPFDTSVGLEKDKGR